MKTAHRGLLLAGILLIATNLRAPFTSVAPMLEQLRDQFALSASQAGWLITLPVLAFAVVSPFAAGLAKRWGVERTLFGALTVIAAGMLLRASGGAAALYLGTMVIGAGIALGNVLLPSLLKRDFSDKVASLTALYVLVMGSAAAASSALVVPLSAALHADWRVVSRLPLALVALAALVWLPQVLRKHGANRTAVGGNHANAAIWRSPLAWQVTAYLGIDSFLFYVGVSWMPGILQDTAGYTAAQAATLHGVLLLATAVPGLLLIPLTPRLHDQRAVAAALALSMAVGMLGFILAPAYAIVWIVFFGIGAGGGLIMGLALISLRTPSAGDAASLSGMAQCVGYFIAAAGPPLVGKLHDLTGNWSLALAVCAAVAVIMAVFGLLAGRKLQIATAALSAATPRSPAPAVASAR
ncbi:MFS transporter [Duganella callida]|uniref:MFS transporter n=1 Tax=Duganella callida TaxID=2561932 RepID=A0A4Y9SQ62_9BURK|nr:MFS transporter [Duganella callida]TFW26526.1 MFS transporter [Duganella callida]